MTNPTFAYSHSATGCGAITGGAFIPNGLWGAGYDTVNVKDCTDAGVLVVNQTGGNADAVAAHVLGMMLMLSKQVVQVNNALRKGTMKDRNIYMGNDINNKTIGIVGLGNVGRRIAKLCATVFDMKVLAELPAADLAGVLQPLVLAYRAWIAEQRSRVADPVALLRRRSDPRPLPADDERREPPGEHRQSGSRGDDARAGADGDPHHRLDERARVRGAAHRRPAGASARHRARSRDPRMGAPDHVA